MTTIFIANFPTSIDEDDLRRLFERYGEVESIKIWRNARTGRSEEWGLVEMEDDDDASLAIERLDGRLWHQRRLQVEKDRFGM